MDTKTAEIALQFLHEIPGVAPRAIPAFMVVQNALEDIAAGRKICVPPPPPPPPTPEVVAEAREPKNEAVEEEHPPLRKKGAR